MAQKSHLIIVGFFLFFGIAVSSLSAQSMPEDVRIEQIFSSLKSSHNINLAYTNPAQHTSEGITSEEITEIEKKRFVHFLTIFEEEIKKYPANFFQRSNLKRIVFVKKLFMKDAAAQGTFSNGPGVMYLDIYRDYGNERAQRHGIHHEIYHVIDTSLGLKPLDEWALFNGEDFTYDREGVYHFGPPNKENYFAPTQAGFVTHYAYTSIEEDKAEVFSCLFIPSQNRIIHQWQKKDEALRRKILYIKNQLKEFCPEVDATYWKNLFKK